MAERFAKLKCDACGRTVNAEFVGEVEAGWVYRLGRHRLGLLDLKLCPGSGQKQTVSKAAG